MQYLTNLAAALSILISSLLPGSNASTSKNPYTVDTQNSFSVSINNNAQYSNNKSINISVNAPPNFNKVRYSIKIFNASGKIPTWQNLYPQFTYLTPKNDGEVTIFLQVLDETKNTVSPILSDSIILDTTAPKGKILINNGQNRTSDKNVTVQLQITDSESGIAEVRISNNSSFDNTNWQTFQPSIPWVILSNQNNRVENHTVYVQAKDNAGNISKTLQAKIILQENPVISPSPTLQPSLTITLTPTVNPSPIVTESPTPTIAPIISSIEPNSGFIGDRIAIIGTNFGNFVEGVSRVLFNNIPAAIVSWTDTLIYTIIPDNSQTGKIQISTSNGETESTTEFLIKEPPLQVINVTGDLTEDQNWTNTHIYSICNINIPSGKALTIEQGTIIKVNLGCHGFIVNSYGTLNTNGTSANPVIITGSKDDSVGGDTDNNGLSSGKDGDFKIAIYALNDNGNEKINISNTTIRYGENSINAGCQSSSHFNITENKFYSPVVVSNCTKDSLSLTKNQFQIKDNYPLTVILSDLSAIPVFGVDKNTFTGINKEIALRTHISYIPLGSTWNIDTSSGLNTLYIQDNSKIKLDGTLNIGAGLIVKIGKQSNGFEVSDSGIINTWGTNDNPVTLTSSADDSIGGNIEGDRPAISNDYQTAINMEGSGYGYVNLNHTKVRYGSQAANIICANVGVDTITDNEFNSPVALSNCTPERLVFQRNHFATDNIYPVSISNSDLRSLEITGTNSNTFTGQDKSVALYTHNAYLPDGAIWDLDSSSGLLVLYQGGNSQTIIEGTLNIKEGMVIKTGFQTHAFYIDKNGKLNISGTSDKPVVITSIRDNSYGGVSYENGYTLPQISDYKWAIYQGPESVNDSINISNTIVRYAETAIALDKRSTLDNLKIDNVIIGVNVSDNANVTITNSSIENAAIGILAVGKSFVSYRGSFHNISDKAIRSCNWETEGCVIDASNSRWDTNEGPFPSSGYLVCGMAVAQPWLSINSEDTIEGGSIFTGGNCDSSPSININLAGTHSSFKAMFDSLQIDCSGGYAQSCTLASNRFSCMDSGLDFLRDKLDISFDWIPSFNVNNYADIVNENTSEHIIEIANLKKPLDTYGVIEKTASLYKDLNDVYGSCKEAQ